MLSSAPHAETKSQGRRIAFAIDTHSKEPISYALNAAGTAALSVDVQREFSEQ